MDVMCSFFVVDITLLADVRKHELGLIGEDVIVL